jgi:ApeA N-terminal domain 1
MAVDYSVQMADENVRLDSRFNLIGAFWLPEEQEAFMTGTLVSGESEIEFVSAPEYQRNPRLLGGMLDPPDNKMIPAFHGFAETGNWTLCQVYEHYGPNTTNFPLKQSIKSRSFHVLTCVEGLHIDGIDHKCLNSAKFSFAGLSEWFPSAFTEAWEPERVVLTIPSEPREILDVSVCESKLRATVRVFPEFTSGDKDLSRISRSVVSTEVRYHEAESLNSYRTVAGRLENLFSLLTGGSVALETLFIYKGDEAGHTITKRPGTHSHFDRMQCIVCSPSELANAISM